MGQRCGGGAVDGGQREVIRYGTRIGKEIDNSDGFGVTSLSAASNDTSIKTYRGACKKLFKNRQTRFAYESNPSSLVTFSLSCGQTLRAWILHNRLTLQKDLKVPKAYKK
ncbi:hypothetical protein ACTXT7_004782 [Hymenolepis weldensis]